MVQNINIADFDYPLPDERIAKHPIAARDTCKLLVSKPGEPSRQAAFSDLPDLLPADAILFANNARVINARIIFDKDTGAKVEVFLLEPYDPADYALMFQQRRSVVWKCLVGNIKRWKSGEISKLLEADGLSVMLRAEKLQRLEGGEALVRFSWDGNIPFADVITAAGFIPIPPYLNRRSEETDKNDYQTVYSRINGSVAAPTAGLHFTPRLFRRLEERGIKTEYLTLHVGAGTFRPVKSETIGGHDMHSESFSVTRETLVALRDAKAAGHPVVAVGTTSVRTLESIPFFARMIQNGEDPSSLSQWTAYENPFTENIVDTLDSMIRWLDDNGEDAFCAKTSILIAPGFKWSVVDVMITNFHQPKSTLLLLVSSFLQQDNLDEQRWRTIYDFALNSDFRFLSYGDACLLFPSK